MPIGRSSGMPAAVSRVPSRSPWLAFASGMKRPVLSEPPPRPATTKGMLARECLLPSSRPVPHIMIELSSRGPSGGLLAGLRAALLHCCDPALEGPDAVQVLVQLLPVAPAQLPAQVFRAAQHQVEHAPVEGVRGRPRGPGRRPRVLHLEEAL